MNPCPKCGLNMDIHGRVHNCNPPKTTAKKSHGTIKIPPLKPDQRKYLQDIVDHQAKGYDRNAMVGGPCPICEARRKVKALQMKRYREKKNG